MPQAYQILDQTKPHFITATIVDWIDIFTRKNYRDIIVDNLRYCIKSKGMILYGYVVMSNHIHIIAQSDKEDLSSIIRDFKKYTSKVILKTIQEEPESRREWILGRFSFAARIQSSNKYFQVWQHGNHGEEIYSENFLWSKLDYIHMNPVRAGIVKKPSAYLYSSAANYTGKKGILEEIEVVDIPVVDVHKPGSFNRYNSF